MKTPKGIAALSQRYSGSIEFMKRRLDRNGPFGLYLTLSIGVMVAAASIFSVLLEEVVEGETQAGIDGPLMRFVLEHRQPDITWIMRVATQMGGLIVVTAVLGLCAVVAWTKTRDGTLTAFFLATLIGALGLDDVIKFLVGRPRPVLGHLVHATGSSFPSGHALAATAMFGALAYVLARRSRPFFKALIWGAALLLSSLVAASRVYLGVHWLTDVLGGMLLGAFWVALTFTVVRLMRGRDELREVGRNA